MLNVKSSPNENLYLSSVSFVPSPLQEYSRLFHYTGPLKGLLSLIHLKTFWIVTLSFSTSRKARSMSLIYRGRFKGNLVNSDHADILKYYNSVIRGVYNYYSFVNNTQDLSHVIWRLTELCALTLAIRFKLKTMKKVYRKFGKDLGCHIQLKDGKKKGFRFSNRITIRRLTYLKV